MLSRTMFADLCAAVRLREGEYDDHGNWFDTDTAWHVYEKDPGRFEPDPAEIMYLMDGPWWMSPPEPDPTVCPPGCPCLDPEEKF